MSNAEGRDFDAATFDLDEWIDGIVRPSVVVELYPYEDDYLRRLAALDERLSAVEAAGDADRGMDDDTVETIAAQIESLRTERDAHTLRVRVRQLTQAEFILAAAKAKKAKAPEREWLLWQVAAMTVAPDYDGDLDGEDVPQHFTGPQLKRLLRRNRAGEVMVGRLIEAGNDLMKGLPVPS